MKKKHTQLKSVVKTFFFKKYGLCILADALLQLFPIFFFLKQESCQAISIQWSWKLTIQFLLFVLKHYRKRKCNEVKNWKRIINIITFTLHPSYQILLLEKFLFPFSQICFFFHYLNTIDNFFVWPSGIVSFSQDWIKNSSGEEIELHTFAETM